MPERSRSKGNSPASVELRLLGLWGSDFSKRSLADFPMPNAQTLEIIEQNRIYAATHAEYAPGDSVVKEWLEAVRVWRKRKPVSSA